MQVVSPVQVVQVGSAGSAGSGVVGAALDGIGGLLGGLLGGVGCCGGVVGVLWGCYAGVLGRKRPVGRRGGGVPARKSSSSLRINEVPNRANKHGPLSKTRPHALQPHVSKYNHNSCRTRPRFSGSKNLLSSKVIRPLGFKKFTPIKFLGAFFGLMPYTRATPIT